MSEVKQNKFNCITCNFTTNYPSKYNTHIETKKHKNNGKIIRRTEEIVTLECDKCDYYSKIKDTFRTHYLTKHGSKEKKEKEFTYYCKFCNFGTFNKTLMNNHLNSKKHKNIESIMNEKI